MGISSVRAPPCSAYCYTFSHNRLLYLFFTFAVHLSAQAFYLNDTFLRVMSKPSVLDCRATNDLWLKTASLHVSQYKKRKQEIE